jgi:hypothetical protein
VDASLTSIDTLPVCGAAGALDMPPPPPPPHALTVAAIASASNLDLSGFMTVLSLKIDRNYFVFALRVDLRLQSQTALAAMR